MTTIKTAISVRADLFRKVEAMCRQLGLSRSQFFARAAEEFIQNNRNRQLREQIDQAHADGPTPDELELLRSIKRKQRSLLEENW